MTASPFDTIDRTLLGACLHSPATLADLNEVSDYPPDVVKSLVHGYVGEGLVTLVAPVRYGLTLTGRSRLSEISRQDTTHTMRKAA